MTLPLFIESKACKSGTACTACTRPGPDGDAWRSSAAVHYTMPGTGECPRGLTIPPAGAAPLTVSTIARGCVGIAKAAAGVDRASDETIAARTAICTACPKAVVVAGVFRQCSICKCATWGKVRLAGESCPDNPPRW